MYFYICPYGKVHAAIYALVRVSRKLCSCTMYILERRSEEMENEWISWIVEKTCFHFINKCSLFIIDIKYFIDWFFCVQFQEEIKDDEIGLMWFGFLFF